MSTNKVKKWKNRKAVFLKRRNRAIFKDFQKLQKRGKKIDAIFTILSKRYRLAPLTIRDIIYG